MLSIRLPSYISCLTRQSINQSIHINLSAGTYIIMLVCRRLLTTRLHGKAAV